MPSKNQVNVTPSTEELTPAQKAALTRKANKEAKAKELAEKEALAKQEQQQEEKEFVDKEEVRAETEDVKVETPTPTVVKDNAPKTEEWFLNDISSPSHERFSLKQGSKRMIELAPKDIAELGLAFDPDKFATRNNYIAVTKCKLVEVIKSGHFDSPKAIVKWAAPADKFPVVEPVAPKKKEPKAEKPEMPETLNFLDEEAEAPVNF